MLRKCGLALEKDENGDLDYMIACFHVYDFLLDEMINKQTKATLQASRKISEPSPPNSHMFLFGPHVPGRLENSDQQNAELNVRQSEYFADGQTAASLLGI